MLNLLVMMFAKIGVFLLMLVGLPGWYGPLAVNRPVITSPRAGEALQGVVAVHGSTDVLDFESAELSFAYQDGGEETWFLIANLNKPVENKRLAEWDTTTIADGSYQLRLRVMLSDGNDLETIIPDLRVRNYSTVETSTPQASVSQPTVAPLPTADVETAMPTLTTYPENPAAVTEEDILASVKWGAILAVASFVIFGMILGLRSLARQ